MLALKNSLFSMTRLNRLFNKKEVTIELNWPLESPKDLLSSASMSVDNFLGDLEPERSPKKDIKFA